MALTVVALAACGNQVTSSLAGGRTLSGTLILLQDQAVALDQEGRFCAGTGPHQDVRPGAAVVVADRAGHVLGRGPLVPVRGALVPPRCNYTFEVVGLGGTDRYVIRLGERELGTFAADELDAREWEVALAVGP